MKIEIIKSTACLILKDEYGEMLDYHFINKYYFDNFITKEELKAKINAFAEKNNLINVFV